MSSTDERPASIAFVKELADAGLDIAHAFDAHAVASLARASTGPLAHWARLSLGPRLGLLVGNTRELWPRFVAARDSLPDRNPLDTYVERAVASAVATHMHAIGEGLARAIGEGPSFARAIGEGPSSAESSAAGAFIEKARDPATVFFSHRRYGATFLPFQALAVATGLAAMNDAGLAVHPTYGPWFALRAVIVLDVADADVRMPAPIAKPCECTGACEKAREAAFADMSNWRAWVAVRDACSLRAWRYSDEQIAFHYTHAWPVKHPG